MSSDVAVDAYIAAQTQAVQPKLQSVRETINEAEPRAVESISYGLPTYKLDGKPLIYFGAFKHHIGLYATPDGHAEFESELSKYKRGKGSVQFPFDEPLPLDLIKRITLYRSERITNVTKAKGE